MQYLTQYQFEWKRKQISLPSDAKGQQRLSKCAAAVIYPGLSMISSCGSTPLLNTTYLPPPPPLGLALITYPSDFRLPSSLDAGQSIHPSVKVNHSPLSTFF